MPLDRVSKFPVRDSRAEAVADGTVGSARVRPGHPRAASESGPTRRSSWERPRFARGRRVNLALDLVAGPGAESWSAATAPDRSQRCSPAEAADHPHRRQLLSQLLGHPDGLPAIARPAARVRDEVEEAFRGIGPTAEAQVPCGHKGGGEQTHRGCDGGRDRRPHFVEPSPSIGVAAGIVEEMIKRRGHRSPCPGRPRRTRHLATGGGRAAAVEGAAREPRWRQGCSCPTATDSCVPQREGQPLPPARKATHASLIRSAWPGVNWFMHGSSV